MTTESVNQPPGLIPIIVGPTAVGKTAVSILLAQRINGEIISADSRQIYKDMKIGTATPDQAELQRVPHHFVNELELTETYTAGRFAGEGRECIKAILSRGNTPIVAGGAGLYIKALTRGLFEEPARDGEIRDRLYSEIRRHGAEYVYERFRQLDPEYASEVHIHDVKKIVRALEIHEVTGKRPSEQFDSSHQPLEYPYRIIGLHRNRKTLYDRINRRVEHMLEEGLVEEVKSILSRGYTGDENALQTVGYQEIINYVRGSITLEEAQRQIQKNSRHYAKRQLTWFRNQHPTQWFRFEDYEKEEALVDDILEYLRQEAESLGSGEQ